MFILIVRLIFAYKVFDAKGLTFTQSMMYHLYMLVSVDKHFKENLILNCTKQILDFSEEYKSKITFNSI